MPRQIVAVAVLLILLAPGVAVAGAITQISFPAECTLTHDPANWTKITEVGNTINVSDNCFFEWGILWGNFHADATASGIASGNTISVYANALAQGDGGYPTSPAIASADSAASDNGQIRITGSGDFEIGYFLVGSVNATDCGYSNATASAQMFVGTSPTSLASTWNYCAGSFGDGSTTSQNLYGANVGDIIPFTYSLDAHAGAFGWALSDRPRTTKAIADLSHTMFVFVRPLTPGASYESLNGVDYSLPTTVTPEPGSIWLCATGVTLFVMRRRVVPLLIGRRRSGSPSERVRQPVA